MAKDWKQRPLDDISHEEKINKCPDCSSKEIEFSDGERFCKKCGLVFD